MAHAWYHAVSSAKRFGGKPADYLFLHEWMDQTKAHLADARHRLLFHNTFGIWLSQDFFGTTFIRASDGKVMPTRTILEQHVLEDLGRIPTLEQCFAQVTLEPWMYKNAKQLSKEGDMQDVKPDSETVEEVSKRGD